MTTSTEVPPNTSSAATDKKQNTEACTQVAPVVETDNQAHAARTQPVTIPTNTTVAAATEETDAADAADTADKANDEAQININKEKDEADKQLEQVVEEAESHMGAASRVQSSDYDPIEIVKQDLGDDIAKLFAEGITYNKKGAKDLDSLQKATGKYVAALEAAGTGKESTAGYGELSLNYGQALLSYVIRGAAAGGVLGGDVESAVTKGKASSAGASLGGDENDDEEDIGDEKETDEDETLTWTNLEVARVAFSKACEKDDKFKSRLAAAHATLGEFLLACDQATDAGNEFEQAAKLYDGGRAKAEALYKKYLALRRENGKQALDGLKESVKVFEQVENGEDVLKELREELKSFSESLGEGNNDDETKDKTNEVKVVTVVPKRKSEEKQSEKNKKIRLDTEKKNE